MKYKSPLRYPGGKSRHIKLMEPLLPEKIGDYREPFFGGGSMFFHVRNKNLAKTHWLNDKFKPLAHFWRSLLDPDWFTEIIEELERYAEFDLESKIRLYKSAISDLNDPRMNNTLAAARAIFIVNRCSYSGSTLSGGFSQHAAQKRFTPSSVVRLKKMATALEGAIVTDFDYQPLLAAPGQNVFLYLDPPYFDANNLYGKAGNMHKEFDHVRLGLILQRCPHRFMLSYDDTPEIRNWYGNFKISSIDVTNSMDNCGKRGKPKQVKELIITNY